MTIKSSSAWSKIGYFWLIALLTLTPFLVFSSANALQLHNRSVQVSSSVPSAVINTIFRFDFASPDSVGSLMFEYCDNSPIQDLPCNAPTGLDVTLAHLVNQTGNVNFGFDGSQTTANRLVLSRTPEAVLIVPSSYAFNNITNTSEANHAIFIRITSYATKDATGIPIDGGAVAFSTLSSFTIGAYVPPFLRLCVGITVTPNCSSISGDSITLGNLSSDNASVGTSQFSTGTNDPSGYVVYILGTTMTSGNNVIPALRSPTVGISGQSQFGVNLRANSHPLVGEDPMGQGTGFPTTVYDLPNFFMFNSGDAITVSTLPTDYNRMTVSYLVNVSPDQPAGVYNSTFTYVATVQF